MLEHRYKHGNCKHGLPPYGKAWAEREQCFECSGLQSLTTEIRHFASNLLDKDVLLAALGPGCLGCILPGLIASDNVWSIP